MENSQPKWTQEHIEMNVQNLGLIRLFMQSLDLEYLKDARKHLLEKAYRADVGIVFTGSLASKGKVFKAQAEVIEGIIKAMEALDSLMKAGQEHESILQHQEEMNRIFNS